MAKQTGTGKKGAGRQKTRPKKVVVRDLDAKRKSSGVKGGTVPIAVLIGKSS